MWPPWRHTVRFFEKSKVCSRFFLENLFLQYLSTTVRVLYIGIYSMTGHTAISDTQYNILQDNTTSKVIITLNARKTLWIKLTKRWTFQMTWVFTWFKIWINRFRHLKGNAPKIPFLLFLYSFDFLNWFCNFYYLFKIYSALSTF